MAIRSVVVRYSADVSSLIRDLDKAAKSNDKLAASTDKASQATDKVGRTSDQAGQRINKLAAGGLAVGLALGVAISKFAEFDAQMSAVAAATGSTGDELKSLRDAAITAGAATQFSATEAAKGITELSKAGVSATDILGGGLTGALNLAAAGQLDVADAAELAATAMTQFSLSGKDVVHVADLLAAGAGKAQGSVGDMGMALKQSGLVASQVGLSIEETTAGLTAFASAGLIGSDAGTSFKSMLQRLTPQSKEAADLMDKLGFSAFDSQGNFKGLEKVAENLKDSLKDLTPEQRNSALATIFGSDAVRAASVLYKEGADGIKKWTEAVNQQGFAAKQAAKLTDNWKGDLERLSGALDTAFIQTGSGANSVLRETTQLLESTVNAVAKIPGPVLLGAGAFTALALVGPKIGQLAKIVTGPLIAGMTQFREEAALQKALAAQTSRSIDNLGVSAQGAATRYQRAAGTITAASRSLKGAASGVLSAVGGPWTIAITAATIGITAFANAQQNAAEAGKEFADTLDVQTGEITAQTRALANTKISQNISGADLSKLQELGVNLGQARDLALEGGDAFQRLLAVLAERASVEDQGVLFSALSSTLQHLNADLGQGKEDWKGWQTIVGGTSDVSASMADHMAQLAAGTEKVATTIQGVSADFGAGADAIAAYDDALKKITDNIATVGNADDEISQKLQDNAQVKADSTKSTKDSWQDYADTVKLSSKDIVKVLDEQTNAAKKFRDNLLIVQKQGDIQFTEWVSAQPAAVAAAYASGTAKEKQAIYDAFKRNVGAQQGLGIAAGLQGEETTVTDAAGNVYKATKDKLTGQTILVPTGVKNPPGSGPGSPAAVEAYIKGVFNPVYVPVYLRIAGSQAASVQAAIRDIRSSGGNIIRAYGSGGMDVANAHVPEIATSRGTVRIWAEPETGGEAYIPLKNDWRRPRAKSIASEAVRRLGGSVQWNAAGSVSGMSWWGGSSGSGIDYRRFARELAKIQQPNLTIVSGEDSKTAARIATNELLYARDNG